MPCIAANSQVEGPVPTQVLVNVDARSVAPASASAVTVAVNNRKEPLTDWQPVAPANAQVALLIDDGLRESVGRELDNLRAFIEKLPAGVEVLVGFMQNGRVVSDQGFTADHALAASTLHLPSGLPGTSASPYLCLSQFVDHWPGAAEPGAVSFSDSSLAGAAQHKARFVLMISNGVDPYNGSTRMSNQDSPYVAAAVTDAQRAGVAVYAIYFADAGIRGGSADNSGQNYLSQLAEETGGVSLWEGMGNPVSMGPFLDQFGHAVSETYIATFPAPAGREAQRDLVRVKFSAAKAKLHSPDEVRPGNQE
ncbi:MAG TPA: hypothetical protein VGU23_07090 [Acidobacteriaceae bacterium]|nr:hypothetical protein [Acidobacteriaceae bacterium]